MPNYRHAFTFRLDERAERLAVLQDQISTCEGDDRLIAHFAALFLSTHKLRSIFPEAIKASNGLLVAFWGSREPSIDDLAKIHAGAEELGYGTPQVCHAVKDSMLARVMQAIRG